MADLLDARTKWGNELRAASKPRRPGTGDGAAGSVVVALDPNAGLIAALAPLWPAHPSTLSHALSSLWRSWPSSSSAGTAESLPVGCCSRAMSWAWVFWKVSAALA